MQRGRAVHDRHDVSGASEGGELGLETLDESPHGGHERRIEALLEIAPLVAGEARLVQGCALRADDCTYRRDHLRRKSRRCKRSTHTL